MKLTILILALTLTGCAATAPTQTIHWAGNSTDCCPCGMV